MGFGLGLGSLTSVYYYHGGVYYYYYTSTTTTTTRLPLPLALPRGLLVPRGVVRLEVDAELLVVNQRLVGPRDGLVGVEQVPSVMARDEAT